MTFGRSSTAGIALILVLAALLIGVDIVLSMRLGLLANPPIFDGLFYVTDARLPTSAFGAPPENRLVVSYFDATDAASPVLAAAPFLDPLTRRAPAWTMLLMLSDTLLGAGPWQPYTARFWPIALLLSVMFVVIRRHSNAWVALAAILVTGMLPGLSVSVRSAAYEYFVAHAVNFGTDWFLADLRPDLAASVALFTLIVVYLDWIDRPTRARAVAIGALFALAMLMKPTVAPAALAVFGVAGIYTLLFRRQAALRQLGQAAVAAGTALALLVPWVLAGGPVLTLKRVTENVTDQGTIWGPTGGDPSAIGFRTTNFVTGLQAWMGAELWIVLGLALLLATAARRSEPHARPSARGYAIVGTASLLIIMSFSGILRYIGGAIAFLWWLAAWCVIARHTARLLGHLRLSQAVAALVASAYCVAFISLSFVAESRWTAYGRQTGQANRQVAQALTHDIGRVAHPDDILSVLEIWGFPLSLTGELGPTARFVVGASLHGRGTVPPDQVADDLLRTCAACSVVVTLDADSVDDSPHLNTPAATRPYLNAVARWVKRPGSPYVLARSYTISADPFTSLNQSEDGQYVPSLLMFLRDDGRPLPARGFDGRRDGIMYGAGWYLTESANGQRFRWAGDEVELLLSPNGRSTLSLNIEPGPDLGGEPLQLSMIGDDGGVTRLPPIESSRAISIEVPGPPTAKRTIRLRNEGPTPWRNVGDRILNFRVFDAYWGRAVTPYTAPLLLQANAARDIGPPDARAEVAASGTLPVDGLFIGDGWHAGAPSGGAFRWANTDAEIVVTRPSGQRRELDLEVEPGPGLGPGVPLDLDIVDRDNQVVATVSAEGRTTVRASLPIQTDEPLQLFWLRPRGGGLPIPNDPRILNLRVFSLRWAAP